MNKKRLEKIIGTKGMSKLFNEIQTVKKELYFGSDVSKSYKTHPVFINSAKRISADAKYVNKLFNQSGRGNYRYVFDTDRKYKGLAIHRSDGSYRMVA